jgi:hypothetical protein
MKIHSVELRNVRQIKELRLDLSAPLSVIGGPNGVGKTTLQQSILAAMFFADKPTRDSFVSQFDPDSAPTVVLGLSRGEPAATIVLTRNLLDDRGEWHEAGATLKKKKQALEKVQEVLPISADAAALLLWGRQDDLPAVVESFPSDGHSLLTAATIKGSGPDPKRIIKELEKDCDNARKGERGGQVVGPLTQARNRLQELEAELAQATRADEELRTRRGQLHEARSRRDQVKSASAAAQTQLNKLAELEQLLVPALEHLATRDQMTATQAEWEGLEEEIDQARKDLTALQKELELLLCQHRVARDEELARHIDALGTRLELALTLETAAADLARDLKAAKRPDANDVKLLHKLQSQIREAQAKVEATGVRYELSAERGPRRLRLTEDGQEETEITLAAGQVHQGIVGRLTVEADGLRFSAAGKEDISGLKEKIRTAAEQTQALFKKFEALGEAAFLKSATEKENLQQALEKKKHELRAHLGGASIPGLRTDLERLLAARTENNMVLQDREACAGKHLPAAAEIANWCSDKRGEIRQAKEGLAALEEKRPSEAEKTLHQKNLEAIRKKAREAAAAFTDVDELHRPPSRELQVELRRGLERQRQQQAKRAEALLESEKKVAGLSGQLKQAQPHRPLDAIQEGRALLLERIEAKMGSLAAHVPVELGRKVTQQLARLTGGSMGQVVLSPGLAVAHVGENGAVKAWQPRQLSHGERHQAALAVKIAVARALAETSGPVFIMLDDSLVSFDPARRAATEDFLLDLVKDGKLQVILLTCHTDWAADWKRRRPDEVSCIELLRAAHYYRPPAIARGLG